MGNVQFRGKFHKVTEKYGQIYIDLEKSDYYEGNK